MSEHDDANTDAQIAAAIRTAWTPSGRLFRVNDTGPVPVIVEVGRQEFTNLVLRYFDKLVLDQVKPGGDGVSGWHPGCMIVCDP